jgi:hypothetical protein
VVGGVVVVWNFIAPLSVKYKRYGMYSAQEFLKK